MQIALMTIVRIEAVQVVRMTFASLVAGKFVMVACRVFRMKQSFVILTMGYITCMVMNQNLFLI